MYAEQSSLRFAAIARVTEDKWVTCTTRDDLSFGLKPGDELQVETTICTEVRSKKEAVYIENVPEDEFFCDHPTPALYGFKSYVSVPIYRKNGSFFGTLCALDPEPAKVNTEEVRGMFNLFADLISFHLDAVQEKEIAEKQLEEELYNSELREQFIAILGHDLKNPIATMRMCSDILLKLSKEDLVLRNAKMIKSTTFRMQALIENILDFARGKLGEGIKLTKTDDIGELEKALLQVINEIKAMSPGRKIETEIILEESANNDPDRVAQLFSNLLGNADTHGSEDTPIKASVISRNGEFKLSVINKGEKISETAMEHLFQPFYKNSVNPGKEGLGLGLFIASEIARAHDGEILVTSTEEETCFKFVMSTN
ncbi:GAF domain-containing sensor histidine kinase [Antarcticibacterium sp. 1MA-6-2]|uniref:sensor histidine kinase n=1 Tax=Antarcticibacterium sp. 1MA-6-2 TaxID=2908210 RepID=UPI001F171A3C|nr:GAF domain-containing sensor histidine kinase [Antarcticibacterium sp. 1MA-6-2]UJH92044.1 GAF domain-containing sensor histidine kinase [Antarcticibacterium sp. 1MA-6-2]